MIKATPFLKWAGGKRQLINKIDENLPLEIKQTGQIDLYIEPFVGGGAIFFHLLSNYSVKKSIINDINPDLILCYKVIKLFPDELIKKLKKIEKEYLLQDEEGRKNYFYNKLRIPYNKMRVDYLVPNSKTWVNKVALLISLNKTCFNGLYRQNSKGEFNVPFGKYKNPKILDEANIKNIHSLLQKTEIKCGSYDTIKIPKKSKAFVYFDPPYRPLNKTSSFTKYSKEDFNDEDQKSLSIFFKKLHKERHLLLLSNSDTKDNFFENLYKGFDIQHVSAKRSINSNAANRGKIHELLIKNYKSISGLF